MIVLVTRSSAATAAFRGRLALGIVGVGIMGLIRCRLRRFTGVDDSVVDSVDDITAVLVYPLPRRLVFFVLLCSGN